MVWEIWSLEAVTLALTKALFNTHDHMVKYLMGIQNQGTKIIALLFSREFVRKCNYFFILWSTFLGFANLYFLCKNIVIYLYMCVCCLVKDIETVSFNSTVKSV